MRCSIYASSRGSGRDDMCQRGDHHQGAARTPPQRESWRGPRGHRDGSTRQWSPGRGWSRRRRPRSIEWQRHRRRRWSSRRRHAGEKTQSAIGYMYSRPILMRLAWLRRVEARGEVPSANGKGSSSSPAGFVWIVPYLGDSGRAVPEAIEGARRAQARPGKHYGQARPSLLDVPRSNVRRRWGIVLGVGGQKGSAEIISIRQNPIERSEMDRR